MKRLLVRIALATAALALLLAVGAWYAFRPMFAYAETQIDPNLWVLTGAGCNTTVLLSTDRTHAVVVDTKMGGGAKRIATFLNKHAPGAQVAVVNTHHHADHVGGNARLSPVKVFAGTYTPDTWKKRSGAQPYPTDTIPPGEGRLLWLDSETVEIRNVGTGHSTSDVVVYFQQRKLLAAGDLVFNGWHPALFASDGTDTRQWVSALSALLRDYPMNTVVPGHGPRGGWEIVALQRDYFRLIADALADPQQLADARAVFKGHWSIPGMSSFDKTVSFIKEQGAH